jgi:mitofilin
VAADAAQHQLEERLERTKSLDEIRGKVGGVGRWVLSGCLHVFLQPPAVSHPTHPPPLTNCASPRKNNQVNVLSTAFTRRSDEARQGTEAHRAALGAIALSKALEKGDPFGREIEALQSGCPDDPLVAAVGQSLPPSTSGSGLPTRAELEKRFEKVAQAAQQLRYFPPGSGGVLAHAAAAAAAALKLDSGLPQSGGADAAVSRARRCLKGGRLLEAAEALAAAGEGTAAAAAVGGWVADARARAVADQNARLLQAHATATAAALA